MSESLYLWKEARVVLTDSGGLQEKTTALGVPCVTIRVKHGAAHHGRDRNQCAGRHPKRKHPAGLRSEHRKSQNRPRARSVGWKGGGADMAEIGGWVNITVKNHPSAGSQAPAWEPSREAPASRVIGTSGKDLKQSFMGTGSQAESREPANIVEDNAASYTPNGHNLRFP